jgi:hypothetical protein
MRMRFWYLPIVESLAFWPQVIARVGLQYRAGTYERNPLYSKISIVAKSKRINSMNHWLTRLTPYLCAAFVFFCCWLKASPVLCGPLRINLSNGTSLEVPYYWEENGEIKFEMPGGVAGIPKAYVTSVQEIVTMREFDPEVLVESNSESSTNNREQTLLELAEKQNPSPPAFEKIGPGAARCIGLKKSFQTS